MIEANDITHSYSVWKGDERFEREALRGVTLDIARGEFVAILGSNGSGKSTYAKHLNALLLPRTGTVLVEGNDTREPSLWRAIRNAVGMVFQNPDNQIIGTSVEEDVAFGPENKNLPSDVIQRKVADSLEAVGLSAWRKASSHSLSGGQKQRVAVAGVLASDSSCIVLDEPTSMLDPVSRRSLMETLHHLHEAGNTIILITHYAEEALGTDRVVLMDQGRVLLQGSPEEVFSQPEALAQCGVRAPRTVELARLLAERGVLDEPVVLDAPALVEHVARAYDERTATGPAARPAPAAPTGEDSQAEVLLELRDVRFTYGEGTAQEVSVLDGVSARIHKGEFLSVVGASGSGKTTLVKHMNGLLKAASGDVLFKGGSIYGKGAQLGELRRHVGLVFQYPENQLFCKTVLEDVAFGPKNLGMTAQEAETSARRCLELVGIGPEYYEMSPFDLSGGQMRRVAVAGVLAMEPDVLVMDEPAAGLDPRAKARMFDLINRIRDERDLTVVLVSHDMEDVADYTDRVLVLHDGRVAVDGAPREVFGDVERMRELGLDVPEAVRVLHELRERGVPVSCSAATVPEAACVIAEAFGEGGGRNAS